MPFVQIRTSRQYYRRLPISEQLSVAQKITQQGHSFVPERKGILKTVFTSITPVKITLITQKLYSLVGKLSLPTGII